MTEPRFVANSTIRRKTPLKSKFPLRNAGKSKSPLRAAKGAGEGPETALRGAKRPRAHQVPKRVREALEARSEGLCEACSRPRDLFAHHRKLRSQGGKDDLDTLLHVCASCHQRIHLNPALSYSLGLLLMSYENPKTVRARPWHEGGAA